MVMMADSEMRSSEQADHTPNFEMPHHDAIHEDNWAEYQAKGFEPVSDVKAEHLDAMQNIYGAHNLYTGDAYDDDAGRPLRHKPGGSIYTSPEGLRHAAEMRRRHEENEHGHQTQSGSDPAAS
jgi:hypothetical protein